MKKKTNNIDPYKRHFNFFSNVLYIFKAMRKYAAIQIVLLLPFLICSIFNQFSFSFLTKYIIDYSMNHVEIAAFIKLIVIFFGILAITVCFLSYYNSLSWCPTKARYFLIMEKNLKVMSIPYENLENPEVLDCYQRATNASSNESSGLQGMMTELIAFCNSLAISIAGFVILGSMNIFITLLLIIVVLINFFMMNRNNRVGKYKVWDPISFWWRKFDYLNMVTTDFSYAKDIRIFSLTEWLITKLKNHNEIRVDAQKKNAKIWGGYSFFSAFFWLLTQGCIYAWLVYSVINKDLTIGNFTLCLTSAGVFFTHLSNIMSSISSLLARNREIDDWRSFMEFKFDNEDDEGEDVPDFDTYEFVFENVSFKYPNSENFVLKNINLTLHAKERLAVVGINGAGKTTFIKLLLRLYEPTTGRILLNGKNINQYNRESYFKVFAPIFQDVNIFAFPLWENISLKTKEKTDFTKINESLEMAGVKNKIDKLPNGINSELLKIIYDDGIDLSGGEKQKLSLARALYKNAACVVLDEPTAALDALAESKLYQDFDKIINKKTAVYISHRLSSTRFCNNIAFFKDGEVIEYGTHEQLLEKQGEYAKMWTIQSDYYKEEE